MADVISYTEYQNLSDEEKQNFEPHWNSDGKSGIATRKGTKTPEVKSTIPVDEMKQGKPTATVKDAETKEKTEAKDKTDLTRSLKVKVNRIRNYLTDETDTTATDKSINPFQTGKETTDKANQMFNSLKAKTDTTATDKSINPFQAGKEIADKAVEDASILLDRAKQLAAKADSLSSKKRNTFSLIGSEFDKGLSEFEKETIALAKELGADIGSLSLSAMKKAGNTMEPLREEKLKRVEEIRKELEKIAEERLAAAKAIQQEAHTKTEEEAAKRKAESKPAPKAQKVAESTRNQLTGVTPKKAKVTPKKDETETEKAETETEKDEKKDPLGKAEELEPESQAPKDIKRFSNDLNKFVIQAYLNGDFGKKSSPNAIATMGYFILDKIGTALVNASQVARGNSPTAKSQWNSVLDKQMELLGKRITAEWLLGLPREKLEALVRSGALRAVTGEDVYGTVDPDAVSRAAERDALGISKLSQEQKGVAQSNINALLARKSELQKFIAQLRSDQGWEVYTQAMNAYVGTSKGLSSLGVTDGSNSSSEKGFSDKLSARVSTGKMVSQFVSGSISNEASWNNSSTEALSKSNSLNQDALALSRFKTGESYANATREAKKEANEKLIKDLEKQIEIIDEFIDSWGKDLGL